MLSAAKIHYIRFFSKEFIKNCGFFVLFILVSSCNNSSNNDFSAAGYNKVIDSANRIYDAGHTQKAINYLDSITDKYKNISLLQHFYYYQINYNFYYHIKNNHDKALAYADSMLNLFDSADKKTKYAQYGQAIFFKGDILFDDNKYEEAYQYYYRGKLIGSNSLDDCTQGEYDYRMGMIMYKQEHYSVAASYFKGSSDKTNTCDWTFRSFYRRQELLSNTGLCYSKINETDSALIYYDKALKYIDSTAKQFVLQKELLDVARGVVYGNEANIYIKKNNVSLAEELLKKSIAINLRKGNDNRDAQLSELKLAHLYEQENKSDSLLKLLQTVMFQFDSIKNIDAEADWNMLMANFYTQKQQPQIAFGYLVKHDEIKDTIARRDKKLKEADITEQMERLKKNNEFDNLKRDNSLQQLYLKIAIVFGAMLLIIIFLIYRNWLRSKSNIKTLGGLNRKINAQNYNLEQALRELNQSSQEKDRILRTVAHDLRNPLGGVASLTGLMAEESEYTPDQKELINLIKDTSNNSLELINEILEATDNASAKGSKEKELVEINALLNHSVELMRFKAAEKNQQIMLDIVETPIQLLINREQIWRVFSNLISNAIKFSQDKSAINVELTDEGKLVKIAVSDNGIGIPDNIKDKIFNMFTEAKRAGTAGEKSFGLGLSICLQIIENHDGKIWFESDGKHGTTFYITLNKPTA